METFFAAPERADREALEKDLKIISANPVIDGLMNVMSGLLAVLNEHRQILVVNDTFLKLLDMTDVQEIIGLRPGESIQCIHAHEMPGGCGTSEYCSSCGAAIAIVACLETHMPVERKCAVTIDHNRKRQDLFFKVRSFPIIMEQKQYILLFLNDISKEQQWGNMERMFFHDLNNVVHAILSRSELALLDPKADKQELAREINLLCLRLASEISIQRRLFQDGAACYQPVFHSIPVKNILKEISSVFSEQSQADHKKLVIQGDIPDRVIKTDFSLAMRILINMITNALEATPENGRVELRLRISDEALSFYVWNEGYIPDIVARRIFQRNFSTKDGIGRGLGTYSMKYFGEEVMGGKVDFTTSQASGTEFRFELPIRP